MWVPKQVVDWFKISKDSVDALREDNAALRAERDATKSQLLTLQANFNWLTVRLNSLEAERAQLLEKAYGIKIPVPEIVRQPMVPTEQFTSAIFEDVGDKAAKEFGLPIYGN